MLQQAGSTSPEPGLGRLNEEHEFIRSRFAELEESIFQAQGSERIMENAGVLVEALLDHCIHEARFMEKIVSPGEISMVSIRHTLTRLACLKEELKQGEIYAALHLRSFCKQWLSEHLHMEEVEFGALVQSGEMQIAAHPE